MPPKCDCCGESHGSHLKKRRQFSFKAPSCYPFIAAILYAGFTSSLASPVLTITSPVTNKVVISWPGVGSYELQATGNLGKSDWAVYTGTIVNNGGTNFANIQVSSGSQFFRLAAAGPPLFTDPTSIPGLAYFWNYNDLPVGSAVNNWTDKVSSVILRSAGNPAPTNGYSGVYFGTTTKPLTNNAILINSNFSLWYVFGPQTNDTGRRVLFGNASGAGFSTSNSIIDGHWGASDNLSSAKLVYSSPDPTYGYYTNILYDIVDSQGTIYTNGVKVASGIGEPTNNFPFQFLGSGTASNNVVGSVQYIGIWTNYALTGADVTNLDNWVNTNGVTNVTSGLIGWWKFDEGSGTNVADSSGNGNNGVLGGNPTWITGLIGKALSFNGNGQVVNVLNTNIAEGLAHVTATFWIQGTNLQQGVLASENHQASIFGKIVPTGGQQGWGVFNDVNPDSVVAYAEDQPGNYVESSHAPTGFNDGRWHFIAAVFQGTSAPLVYVDTIPYPGSLEMGGGSVTSIANTNMLVIGGDDSGLDMSGTLDDFRLYSRALTTQEIYILFRWRGQ